MAMLALRDMVAGTGATARLAQRMLLVVLIGPAVLGGGLYWARQADLVSTATGVMALVGGMSLISGALAWRMVRLVGRSDAERDVARAALVEANRGLADEVRTRAAELDRALERLRTLVRLAPVGIAELDACGDMVTMNARWRDLTGLDEESAAGHGWLRCVHPDDREAAQTAWAAAVRDCRAVEVTQRVVTADGDVRWVQARSQPLMDEKLTIGHLATIVDVTGAFAAQRALRESEERLKLLLDNTADCAIFMLDPQGRITSWYAGAELMLGYSAEEVVGQSFAVLHPADGRADGVPGRELQLAKESGRHEAEGWRIRRDGSSLWVEDVVTAVRGENGELVGFTEIVRDRTERRQSETKFEGLLEAAPDALLGVGTDGRIQLVNTQAERLFGYRRTELLGQPIEILVPERAKAAHPGHRRGYFGDPQVRPMGAGNDLSARRKDGSEFPAEISLSSINTPEGILVTAAVRDVSERRAFEVVVAEARDVAERAARSRQEFLANMSHEIRTPMNAVIGMTSLLLDSSLDEQQRSYLETVRASGEHLLAIINDILDYAKIDAGRLVLEEIPFDVREWLHASLDLVCAQAQEKGLEIVYDVDPDVSRAVLGDPGRLRQVVVNLLSNAVKFTERGEVVVRVRRRGAEFGVGQLQVEVCDTGVGIPPERAEQLFHPFTQADSTTTRLYGGTGLGLAISRQLAEAMGGSLELEADPRHGTNARFSFPAPPAEVPAGPGMQLPADPDGELAGRRILVVEDNLTSRQIYSDWAKRRGMECHAVDGATEALALIDRQEPFDFALVDLTIPGMDGVALGATLKVRSPDTRLTLLSSAGPRGRDTSASGAFDAVLSKPIREDSLFDVMAQLQHNGTIAVPVARTSVFDLPGQWRPMAILVVEDTPVNQKVAVHLLARFGYRADVAASGREALRALENRDYDLVLMDVQMPEMDGLEATRRIRERWPQRPVRIAAMTANVADEDVRRCQEAGMDGFLGKPILVDALASLLRDTGTPAADTRTETERLLGDLCEELGRETVREIADAFLDAIDEALPALDSGCREHDRDLLASTAHRLKGGARNLGIAALGAALADLESRAPEADWPELESLVVRIVGQRGATHDLIEAELT